MKKTELIFLISFSAIEAYLNFQKNFITLASKNFKEVYFMNSDNLKLFPEEFAIRKKLNKEMYKKFPKNIKFFNPTNFYQVDKFLEKKNPLVINNIGRTFEVYGILRYLKKKQISQIILGNIGNLQATVYYWQKYNLNIIKYFFTKLFSRWFSTCLVFLGILNPIEIRFVSNKKIFYGFKKRIENPIYRFLPKYYKDLILVKSKIFDDIEKEKKTTSEKYIVHLDQYPEYREMKVVKELDGPSIQKHYEKLNILLEKLSKMFNKEVVISIHPLYNQKKTEKRFKKFKVFKFKTEELIKKSFLVLCFDSSAILQAIKLKKKIIAIRSKLFFGGKKYNSDLYSERIGLKTLNINEKIILNKKKLLNELNSNIKKYDKYLNEYSSANVSN